MKGQKKIILILIIAVVLIVDGMPLMNPMRTDGQTREKTVLSQEGARDPFLLPSGVHLLSKAGPASSVKRSLPGTDIRPAEGLMKVKAILISDHVQLALIDRHIVTIGDSIRGEKILEIKTDRVTLGKGDQKRTLLLSQSPVRLTVDERPLPSNLSPQGGSEGRDKGE